MSGPLQPTADEIATETEKFNSISDAKIQESEYVHDVYNEIASHFSQTRYKPWPIVSTFLSSQTDFSLGIDVGCGNGKYLNVNSNLFMIGSDYSTGLIDQASQLHKDQVNNDILVADGLNLPHQTERFDFAISIAVIHHFATRERRVEAIKEILRCVKSGGQFLVYCWALEQEGSRRGWKEGGEQDVLVPWVLAKKQPKKKKTQKKKALDGNQAGILEDDKSLQEIEEDKDDSKVKPETKMRFYHLYRKGELAEDCVSAGAKLITEGYERDNWYAIVEKL